MIEGRPYLVDTPNGVAGQLAKARVRLNDLFQIFVTHNHSDHVIDAGTLMVLAWGAGLNSPVQFHGPPPLKQILRDSLAASRFDIAVRMREEGRTELDPLVHVSERSTEGLVYQDPRVKVTSTLVDHYTVKPAFVLTRETDHSASRLTVRGAIAVPLKQGEYVE